MRARVWIWSALFLLTQSVLFSGVLHAEEIFEVNRDLNGQPQVESNEGRQYPLIPMEDYERSLDEIKKNSGFRDEDFNFRFPAPELEMPTPESIVGIFSPASYSFASQQTSIKDQLGRGSCWAFASVAGVEAAYKRKYGVSIDLSSQYAFHIGKAGELYPDYATNTAVQHENNSSYWGFQGNSGFVYNLIRAALPKASDAPYLSSAQMDALKNSLPTGALDWNSTQEQLDALEWSEQNIPTHARWNAKYRPTSAINVFDSNKDVLISKLEASISSGHEVIADFSLKWKWDSAKNAYDYDAATDSGGHVMLIIGYDRPSQIFTLKNSWGGTNYLRVTYNFIKNAMLWGTSVADVDALNAPNQVKAYWLGNWNMDHDGWRGKLVLRRFTDFRNSNESAATKVGNYYRDGKRYDVNGYFEDNGQHLVFTIANDSNRVVPGTMTGQRHDLYVFSWDASKAAGKTYWQSIPFGSELSRGSIVSAPAREFHVGKWIGSWAMNHDGWKGTLTITGFRGNELLASYKAQDGHIYSVTGAVDSAHKHRLALKIGFPGNLQPFELLHHTWEDRIFSGVTQWGGRSFGVQGLKL